jgi:cell division protein ZapA
MKKGFGISTIVIRETKVRAPSGAPVRKAKKMADVLEFVKFNALEEKIKGLVQNQASLKQRNQELEGLLRQQELSVLSDSGDDHVARVVEYVNEKVEEIRKNTNNFNTLNIAILAALNIADEYLTSKSIEEHRYNQLENRSERLIDLINGKP